LLLIHSFFNKEDVIHTNISELSEEDGGGKMETASVVGSMKFQPIDMEAI